MKIHVVNPRDVFKPLKPTYSNVVKVEDAKSLVFISGQVAFNKKGEIVGVGDPEAQTRQALENLKACVEAVGGTIDSIVKVTFYLKDIKHFEAVHKVRAEYFRKNPPASTLVQITQLVHPDLLVEVEAIAVV